LSNGRKSARGRAYDPVPVHPVFGAITPRTFKRIYAALDEIPRRYSNALTYERINRGQPTSQVVQAARRLPRQVQAPRGGQEFHHVRVGDALVDVRTGEILSAKRTAERIASDPCARKRENRRAAVLASGNGGVNGVRNYSKHKEC